MKRNIFTLVLAAVAVLGGAFASNAEAQTVFCPYGYTCTPIVQTQVFCPYGYTCVPINQTYPTYPTYQNPVQTGPLRVIAPNGGESWLKGTVQSITWTAPAYFRATYTDIKLVPSSTSCNYYSYTACPLISYAPYTIATGLSINQNAYSWNVGQAIPQNPILSSITTVPDGRYTVQICETGTSNCDVSDSAFSIYSSGTNPPYGNQTPVVSGIDAPTTLSVGQTGTWTIHAYDPLNGTLSYTVDWGDQPILPYASAVSSVGQTTQNTSFTHSYSTTGIFTVSFTVKNSAGLFTTSKTTVNVGSVGNSQDLKVISPNGGESWKLGTQHTISWTGQSNNYPYASAYPYVNQSGYVRITMDYRCPSGSFCTAMYRPTYTIQQSAPNSGSSVWNVGSVTLNGSTGTTAPSGTYIVTICRYDSYYQPTGCDSSDNYFTITD